MENVPSSPLHISLCTRSYSIYISYRIWKKCSQGRDLINHGSWSKKILQALMASKEKLRKFQARRRLEANNLNIVYDSCCNSVEEEDARAQALWIKILKKKSKQMARQGRSHSKWWLIARNSGFPWIRVTMRVDYKTKCDCKSSWKYCCCSWTF